MKKDFTNKLTPDKDPNDGVNMTSMFGKGNDNRTQNEKKHRPTKIKMDVLSFVEKMPIIKTIGIEKMGYITLSIILFIQSIYLAVNKNWGDSFGGIILLVLTLFLIKKTNFIYTDNHNYFLSNLTTTLRALFLNIKFTSVLMDKSKELIYASIWMMMIQHFILSLFLFHPISNSLYSLGYYLFILIIMILISNRETKVLYEALTLFCIYQLILIISNGFVGLYVNYHTVISYLIFWTLACIFKQCKIVNIEV